MKRAADIVMSALGLTLASPLVILIAVLILLTDPGHVFFGQERVGRYGRPFRLWKFRTMRSRDAVGGPAITLGSRDRRITRFGYLLRMTKLDELPQLLNVLAGQMSLVGPRPEVEKYVRLYTDAERRVLDVRPGCADIAMLNGHLHDARLLDGRADPEAHYVNVVMRKKLEENLRYLDKQTLWLDTKILIQTTLLLLHLKRKSSILPLLGQD